MSRWLTLIAAIVIFGLSVTLLVTRANSDQVLKRAATALAKEPSYRSVFSIETKSGATFAAVMSGAVDQRTKVGRFTLRFTFPGLKKAAVCDMITSPSAAYIAVPPAHRKQFNGKPWVSTGVSGLLPIQGFGTKGFDPSSFASIHDLKKTGTDTVRGVAATTYRGTLDIDTSKLTQTVGALPSTSVPDHVPVDIWVADADGLIRKIQDSFVTHTGTIDITTTTTFEYFDFGVPGAIGAPPAAQVATGDASRAIAACVT